MHGGNSEPCKLRGAFARRAWHGGRRPGLAGAVRWLTRVARIECNRVVCNARAAVVELHASGQRARPTCKKRPRCCVGLAFAQVLQCRPAQVAGLLLRAAEAGVRRAQLLQLPRRWTPQPRLLGLAGRRAPNAQLLRLTGRRASEAHLLRLTRRRTLQVQLL